MTRLQQFLHDNPPNGQDGIDLYNHCYFADIRPTVTTRVSAGNNTFIMEHNRQDNIRYKEMPNGNIRGYINNDRKSGVSEAQYMHPNNPAGTLTTAHEPKVIEPINAQDGCARTIKAQYAQTSNANLKRDDSFGATGATDGFRVRKLTPKECFRLMGVADTDADKMIAVLSKSRCYQVAGNSIVVDVLAAIFSQLFIGNTNNNQQTEFF